MSSQVTTGSSLTVGTNGVVAYGNTDGATVQNFSGNVIGGTTYYIYNASGGCTITKIEYTYTISETYDFQSYAANGYTTFVTDGSWNNITRVLYVTSFNNNSGEIGRLVSKRLAIRTVRSGSSKAWDFRTDGGDNNCLYDRYGNSEAGHQVVVCGLAAGNKVEIKYKSADGVYLSATNAVDANSADVTQINSSSSATVIFAKAAGDIVFTNGTKSAYHRIHKIKVYPSSETLTKPSISADYGTDISKRVITITPGTTLADETMSTYYTTAESTDPESEGTLVENNTATLTTPGTYYFYGVSSSGNYTEAVEYTYEATVTETYDFKTLFDNGYRSISHSGNGSSGMYSVQKISNSAGEVGKYINGRLEFYYQSDNGKNWWMRDSSRPLFVSSGQTSKMAIKVSAGDKVKFNGSGLTFKNNKDASSTNVEGKVEKDAVVNDTEYTAQNDGYITIQGAEYAVMNKIIIIAHNDILSAPIFTKTAVHGKDRKVTIASYSTADGITPTVKYSTTSAVAAQTGTETARDNEILVEGATTVYAYATSIAGGDATNGSFTGPNTAVTLNAPTITQTAMVDDATDSDIKHAVVTITPADQSSLELAPTATITYKLGDVDVTSDVVAGTYTFTKTGTLTATASCEGYTSAETTIIRSCGYTVDYESADYKSTVPADLATNWTEAEDWTSITGLSEDYVAYKNNAATYSFDRFRNVAQALEYITGWGYGRDNANSVNLAVRYSKIGNLQCFKVNTSNSDVNATPSYIFFEDYKGTGLITDYYDCTLPTRNILQQHIAYTPNTAHNAIETAIADCKVVETDGDFSNAIDSKYYNNDFITVAEVYAFHSAWQIAKANTNGSTDYSKAIMNRTFELHNTNGWTITGTAATGGSDSDNNGVVEYGEGWSQYYTGWNGRNVSQTIASLPAGTYRLTAKVYSWNGGAPVRLFANGQLSTAENGDDHDPVLNFTVTGNEASIKIGIGGVGNNNDTDNTWGTWGYRVKNFTLTQLTAGVTVGKNGYTTFASHYALDLTDANRPEGLKAYKATLSGSNLSFQQLHQTVPAGTGLLLLGETNDGTYNIPVVESGDAVETALTGVLTPTAKKSDEGGDYYFVMRKANTAEDALTFAPITTAHEVTIPAGKVYVTVPSSAFGGGGARAIAVSFDDDETTGIDNLTPALSEGEGVVYNLNGQRIDKPAKGLYIVNGKKVLVK